MFQTGQIPTALAALALVVGLIWLLGRAARWGGYGRAAPRGARNALITVEDTVTLDRTRRLHLVRCAGHDLLLMTGGGCDQVLALESLPTAARP